MSYIRSTSNPESLYIWSDGKNANISVGRSYKSKGRLEVYFLIPVKTFETLLKKSNGFHKAKYRGASVKEVYVRSNEKRTKFDKLMHMWPGDYQMRLSYKNWHVDMWKVTWYYICKGVT